MGLDDLAAIDFRGIDSQGCVELHIVITEDWTGSHKQLGRLQTKVENYMRYVVQGQMAEDEPAWTGASVRVVIDVFYEPSGSLLDVYARVAGFLEEYGIGFGSEVMQLPSWLTKPR